MNFKKFFCSLKVEFHKIMKIWESVCVFKLGSKKDYSQYIIDILSYFFIIYLLNIYIYIFF